MASSFNGMLDRVQSSMDAQAQLVADASHELRTPVSALRTNVEVLAHNSDALSAEQRDGLLRDIVAQADELGVVVADVIDLARGQSGTHAVEDVRLDLLIREAVERARRHAPSVVFVGEVQPTVLSGTPERLARAINNLLDNAAKYGPADGRVEITLRHDSVSGAAEMAVRDYGPGVAPDEREHIFDRFARGAQSRAHHGSGLGLAIVRQVAQAHGGDVCVEDAPGGGARFVMRLPGASVPEAG
jgi:two-component system sensor histidine kinase MprB